MFMGGMWIAYQLKAFFSLFGFTADVKKYWMAFRMKCECSVQVKDGLLADPQTNI